MNRCISHFCLERFRFVCAMNVWSVWLAILVLSNFATARVLQDLPVLKTIDNVLSKESVVQSLSDPKFRSGAADCDLDVQRFADALSRKELWAVRVLDSSSYFITGILHGNTASLGNYDQCLRATPPDNKYWSLYSLVDILVEKKKNSAKDLTKSYNVRTFYNTSKTGRNTTLRDGTDLEEKDEWITMMSFNLGICWIRSCGTGTSRKAVAGVLSLADGALKDTGYRLRVAPPLPGAEDVGLPLKLGRADWVVICLCIVIGSLVLFGTLLDLAMVNNSVTRRNSGWKMGLLAFSVYTNGHRLIAVNQNQSDALTAIGGLKVISILWVMLGHRYLFMMDAPYINKIEVLEQVKDWGKEIILGGPLAVDTFFTIGGILNTYVFFISMGKGRGISIIQFFIHRYIRLTPALALMIAITATWFFHISSGPLWLKLAGDARAKCQNNWWTSLLYVSNYVHPNEQCMMQSWYLMVDMQLHWFSILVLFPFWRWRRVTLVWLTFLIGVSCAIPFAVVYINGYRTPIPTQSVTDPGSIDTTMENIYFPTHTRATSYLVGLLFGYYLYQARFVANRFRMGLWTVVTGWTLCSVLLLVAIFSAYPLYQFDQKVSIWSSAFYVGFYRLAWSFSIGWIVTACATGYGGPVNGFLSWSPFVVLGRLVYGMYLTHAAVQMADVASLRSSDRYSDFSMVEKALSDFVLSASLGAILCLGMESPISALEKIFLHRPRREGAHSKAATPRRTSTVTVATTGVDNPSLDAVDVTSEQRQPQTNL